MINWDDVVPGETNIASPRGLKGLVGGLHKDWVWLHFADNGVDTYHRNSLSDWSIEDPWEDVTEECGLGFHHGLTVLYYKNKGLNQDSFEFGNFKLGEGLRVFKRKER